MSRFAWIAVLIVLGIAFYNHFQGDDAEEGSPEEKRAEVEEVLLKRGAIPPLPEGCRAASEAADNALYGAANHRVSFAQRNRAVRIFQSCLRDEGFSDQQVDGALAEKIEKIKGYLKVDEQG